MKLATVEYCFHQHTASADANEEPISQFLRVHKVEMMLPATAQLPGVTIRTGDTGWTFNSENWEQLEQLVKGPR